MLKATPTMNELDVKQISMLGLKENNRKFPAKVEILGNPSVPQSGATSEGRKSPSKSTTKSKSRSKLGKAKFSKSPTSRQF